MMLLTLVNVLLRGIGMLFQVYLAGRIGAAGLGLLQLILSAGSLAMTVGISGSRVAVMYLCAEEFGHRRLSGVRSAVLHGLCYGALCSAAAAGALYALAAPIASRYVGDLRAAGALRLLALSIPANTCCAILSGYFTACGRIRRLTTVEVCERLLSVLFTVVLLFFAQDDLARSCEAIAAGSGLACVFSAAWLLLLFLRATRGQKSPPKAHAMTPRLLRLSVPLAASDYLRMGLSTIEQFLIPWGLARAGGTQEASMAAYGAICGMVFPVLMFPASMLYALSDLLVPKLALLDAQADDARIQMLVGRCLRMGVLFAGACAALLLSLSGSLGQLLYDSERVGRYLAIFAPTILFLYLDAITDGMLKGLGQQLASARYNTLTSFLDVVFLYLLLPRFGLAGYYVSFVATHLVNFALSIRRLVRVTGYRLDGRTVFRTLFSAGAAGLSCFCFSFSQPFLLIVFRILSFCLVFFLLLSLTNAISPRDLRWLRKTILPRSRRKHGVDTAPKNT